MKFVGCYKIQFPINEFLVKRHAKIRYSSELGPKVAIHIESYNFQK